MYDASGAKLQKIVKNNTATPEVFNYVNGVEYKDNVLQRLAHTEGAVVRQVYGPTGAISFDHEYVLRDHLGNVRVTFTDGISKGDPYWRSDDPYGYYWTYVDPNDGNVGYHDGVITQNDIKTINSYYPFGMDMEGNWNGSFDAVNNRYKYNEKEWNNDFGLGLYDYGARFYDPAAARWWSVDPSSEKMWQYSPYNYCFDNPIRFVDPDGREGKGVGINNKGKIIYDDGINDGKLYYFANNSSDTRVNSLEGASTIANGTGQWSKHADTKSFFDALLTRLGYGSYLNYSIGYIQGGALLAVSRKGGKREVDKDGIKYLSFKYDEPTLQLSTNEFNFNIFTLFNLLSHEGFHLEQVSGFPSEDLWLNEEDYDYEKRILLEIPAYEHQKFNNIIWDQIEKLAGKNKGPGGQYPYEPSKSQKFFKKYLELIEGNYEDAKNEKIKYQNKKKN